MTRPKSLEDLEWRRVVEAVAARCRGPLATRLDLPIVASREAAAVALTETREAFELLTAGERLPVDGAAEVGPHLQRVERQAALDAVALRDVMRTLAAARSLRTFLSRRKDRLPALHRACAIDPTLDRLHDELAACIESDGTLADHASPELRRLRTEVANLRARMVRRLEQMLVEREAILQDRFYTVREGRYVLPVRRDAHEKLPGIVHGASASGQTVFVEPRALVAQGNRLKMAQAELEREELRILAELSELVRERFAELRAAIDALDHADLRQASAQLGHDLGGRPYALAPDASIELRGARHPLLLLDGVDVVGADLALRHGQGLVLSGPNAGGKTVALKTLGLAALFARAGLPFPADEGSSVGFFDEVLTDVGDDQSLQRNLSTFSAHMSNQARILQAATSGSLVLLDEVATGTDPQEGAALACALVAALLDRGAAVAVTTHYELLKAFAARDERLQNAAVGFDVATMSPTFELLHGVPGPSSAMAVARRFGIPEAVLENARAMLPDESATFEELSRALAEERRTLAVQQAALATERAELEQERARLTERARALAAQREQVLDAAAAKLRDELHRARTELRQTRRALKKKQDERSLAEARRRIEEAAKLAARRPPREANATAGSPVKQADLSVGARVWVPRLRSVAQVVEPPARGRVRVAAGAMRLLVGVDELRTPSESMPARRSTLEPTATRPAAPPGADNTLDLRGMRVDDALSLAEAFLDRMYGASESVAYIVHGEGSGALRSAVRELLGRSPRYVASFGPAPRERGGNRLTVVRLK